MPTPSQISNNDISAQIVAFQKEIDAKLYTLKSDMDTKLNKIIATLAAFAVPVDVSSLIVALKADMDAKFAAIGTNTGGGTGGGTVPPPTVDFFPADPTLAPFPSPENSQVVVFNNAIAGRPYLKDQEGAIHTLRMVSGVPQYFKNDQEFAVYTGEAVGELLVRQGEVYMSLTSGIWKHVDPNGTMYNRALPNAWVSGGTPGTGTPGLPALPSDPVPSPVAPGSSGHTVTVGPSGQFQTITAGIQALQAGDTLDVAPGTYKEAPPTIMVPALLQGHGTAVIDVRGIPSSSLARQKGALVPAADCVIDGFEIIGAGMDLTVHDSTAGIRPDAGCGYLTIKNCNIHDNQNGLTQGGFPCVITDFNSVFKNNGLPESVDPSGGAHNIYVSGGAIRLVLNGTVSTQPTFGHAVKCRANSFEWHGGAGDSIEETVLDLPDGTTTPFIVDKVTLTKPAGAANHGVIGYCMESQTNGAAGGSVTNGTINALCDNPSIQTQGGSIKFSGETFTGNPVTAAGSGTVTGL